MMADHEIKDFHHLTGAGPYSGVLRNAVMLETSPEYDRTTPIIFAAGTRVSITVEKGGPDQVTGLDIEEAKRLGCFLGPVVFEPGG